MADHAKLSPSAAHRWMACSASILYPQDGKSSAAADEGTRLHGVAESILKTNEATRLVSDEDMRLLLPYLSLVDLLPEMHGNTVTTLIEHKVTINDVCWGTADAIVYSVDRLDIVDLKTGTTPVRAKQNKQMMIYAIAAIVTLGLDPDLIKKVVLHVAQPSIDNMDSWETTVAELHDFGHDLDRAIDFIQSGIFEYAPSPTACQWCPGAGVCKVRAKQVLISVAQDFDDLVVPNAKPALPDPDSLSPYQMAALFPHFKTLSKWMEQVEEHIVSLMLERVPIAGLKLVRSVKTRKWTDDTAAVEAMRAAGLKLDDCAPRKPIALGAAEKLVDPAKLAHVVVDSSWRPMPVIESDRRPALTPEELRLKLK